MQAPHRSPQKEQKRIGAVMLTLMWVGIFIILSLFFSNILDKQRNPNQAVDTHVLSGDIKELVLKRNKMGHYIANGRINGQSVTFMLDTGATDVSIPGRIAQKLNLKPGAQATYRTANGPVKVRMTMLNTVSLGEIKLQNVRATINPGYKSNEILLGMSFLKHLEFSQRGNTLTLRQYPEG